MDYYLLTQDLKDYRFLIALGTLVIFWASALVFPYRKIPFYKNIPRFVKNLIITSFNSLLVVILIPFTLIEVAQNAWLQEKLALEWNPLSSSAIGIILGVLILDVVIYWQHRLTHTIPILWRLHRFHHSDIEIDTTTSGRFHFLEIVMSFFVKAATILIFGIHPLSVITFEIILNAGSNFNHSNFNFPNWIEKPLRWVLITPEIHRIHHSTLGQEMNSNYGFSTSLWDRIFFSYRETSKESPKSMDIGLKKFRSAKDQRLLSLLLQPFR